MDEKKSKFIIWAIVLIVILRIPVFFIGPDTDTGILSVTGLMIDHGFKLYSQIWDNKTPGMYYMFALLIRIFGASFYAFAVLGIINLFLLSLFVYHLSKKLFDVKIATYSLFIFILTAVYPVYSLDGLDTEYFFLLFIVLGSIFIFKGYEKNNLWYFFISGILFGISFAFKQLAFWNIIAGGVFISYKVFIKNKPFVVPRKIIFLLLFIGGVVLVQLLWLSVFYLNNDFNSMTYAVFEYNTLKYVGQNNILNISISKDVLFYVLRATAGVWIVWTLGIAFLFLSIKYIFKDRILFINLMLMASIIAISNSGRFFGHYFLQAVPWLSIYSAYALVKIVSYIRNKHDKYAIERKACLLIILLSSFFLYVAIWGFYINKYAFDNPYYKTKHLVTYLKDNMGTKDTLYMWGNPVSAYLLMDKVPLTKYTFIPSPLTSPDPRVETLSALRKNKPDFIVKSSVRSEMKGMNEFLKSNYQCIYSYRILPFNSGCENSMEVYRLNAKS